MAASDDAPNMQDILAALSAQSESRAAEYAAEQRAARARPQPKPEQPAPKAEPKDREVTLPPIPAPIVPTAGPTSFNLPAGVPVCVLPWPVVDALFGIYIAVHSGKFVKAEEIEKRVEARLSKITAKIADAVLQVAETEDEVEEEPVSGEDPFSDDYDGPSKTRD